jgi:tRNA(adenine34) deaminase
MGATSQIVTIWEELHPIWQNCFELAWEAFQAKGVAVGALIVDPDGEILVRGRNRRGGSAEQGVLEGTDIGHAEIDVLSRLPSGHYPEHVMYTTLEPCFLCTMALRYAHVGTVRFAASDAMLYGIEKLPDLNHHIARRWARREGPIGGPLRLWASALPLVNALDRGVRSAITTNEAEMPQALRIARHLVELGPDNLRDRTLQEVLTQVGDQLLEAGS